MKSFDECRRSQNKITADCIFYCNQDTGIPSVCHCNILETDGTETKTNATTTNDNYFDFFRSNKSENKTIVQKCLANEYNEANFIVCDINSNPDIKNSTCKEIFTKNGETKIGLPFVDQTFQDYFHRTDRTSYNIRRYTSEVLPLDSPIKTHFSKNINSLLSTTTQRPKNFQDQNGTVAKSNSCSVYCYFPVFMLVLVLIGCFAFYRKKRVERAENDEMFLD